jgi:enamidase
MSCRTWLGSALTLSLIVLAVGTDAGGQSANPALQGSPNVTIVLTNARIIDGTGAPATTDQTLVIEDGRIKTIGPSSQIAAPPGARVLDLSGRSVMPGLVMMHEHLNYSGGDELMRIQPFSAPRLFLAFGVTTIRTAGINEPYAEINLKRRIDRGLVPGPETFVSGPWFNEPEEGPGFGREFREEFLGIKFVRDADDARRAVRYWAAEGVTSIKVYRRTTPAMIAVIVAEAHRLGLPVMGHIAVSSCREAADAGIDYIEHGFACPKDLPSRDPESPEVRELIRVLVMAKVTVDVTPVSADALTETEREVLHPAAYQRYVDLQRSGQDSDRGQARCLEESQGSLQRSFSPVAASSWAPTRAVGTGSPGSRTITHCSCCTRVPGSQSWMRFASQP